MTMLAQLVAEYARSKPDAPAFIAGEQIVSWQQYAALSDHLAAVLLDLNLPKGDRVAVWLPDGADLHTVFLAVEKAGLVTMGIGPRAGRKEVEHLIKLSGATALISLIEHRELQSAELVAGLQQQGAPLRHLIALRGLLDDNATLIVDGDETALVQNVDAETITRRQQAMLQRRHTVDELFLLNSTSGTTGMPKCVMHNQSRWIHYHDLALDSGGLRADDIFLGAIPATFGFGVWTSHFTPTLLGAPTVLLPKFSAEAMLEAIQKHRVTVLAAVSTQFIMMLNCPTLAQYDLSSLRILYTGGEAVPYERAAEFERTTGASVLQFYGSNETGALSYTSIHDTREQRLTTAGKIIPSMQVRLLDEHGADITATGRGQPACKGAVTSMGYYNDANASKKLYSPDGWMLTGDIAELDADGYLKIVGRTADFIIRGGKNISGPAAEQAVATHPHVTMAAAVAMPDPVFGERVCVYVTLQPGTKLTLPELIAHLDSQGCSKEYFPERLIVVDELPYSSGGKVAKQILREDIKKRLQAEL
ncbi:MAG TPA: class I adenylate-forming enzyme family protein [Spongiibacteraceae bacterium]|nr:class I adenylate-forming enzyme family protein [Spongiibacteraceae bacterium]